MNTFDSITFISIRQVLLTAAEHLGQAHYIVVCAGMVRLADRIISEAGESEPLP